MSYSKTKEEPEKQWGICAPSLPSWFCEKDMINILEHLKIGEVKYMRISKNKSACKSAFIWFNCLYDNELANAIYDTLNRGDTYGVIYDFPKFLQLTLLKEFKRNDKRPSSNSLKQRTNNTCTDINV